MYNDISHAPPQVQERDRIARYLHTLYRHYVLVSQGQRAAQEAVPYAPTGISEDLRDDCHAAARVLAQAIGNTYRVPWDAERYFDKIVSKTGTVINVPVEDDLMRKFRPLGCADNQDPTPEQYSIIPGPCVIADCHGKILVWSLPKILSERRQTILLQVTRNIEDHVRVNSASPGLKPGKKWRAAARFFQPSNDWRSGQLCFSPAWFVLGQKDMEGAAPVSSPILKHEDGISWMQAWAESSGLLDGILLVTHPALYQAAAEVQVRLIARLPALRDQLTRWPSVFNCVHYIVNRMTVHHRDTGGRPGWFDMLLTLGTYGETGVMNFRNLGATVPYDAGSMVMVASRVVIHAVPEVPMDRICYAFFMADTVHEYVLVEDPGWSKVSDRLRMV